MFKRGILLFIILLLTFCWGNYLLAQEEGEIDLTISVNSPSGEIPPAFNTTVLEFNMAVSSLGPVTIDNIVFKENNPSSTAVDYKLYQLKAGAWSMIAGPVDPISSIVEFNGLDLDFNAESFSRFQVRADTTSTLQTYSLLIENFNLSLGTNSDNFPLSGNILTFPEEILDPVLKIESPAEQVSGDMQQSEELQELFKFDVSAENDNVRITKMVFEETYGPASNYSLKREDEFGIVSARGVFTRDGKKIIFNNLDSPVLKDSVYNYTLQGQTTSTYAEYNIRLIAIETEQPVDIVGLPKSGGLLIFPDKMLEVNLSAESPTGTITPSTESLLYKFSLKALNADIPILSIVFLQDLEPATANYPSDVFLKEVSSDQVLAQLDTTSNAFIFSNFSDLVIERGTVKTFEVRGDVTNTQGDLQLQLSTISNDYTHQMPELDGNLLTIPGSIPNISASLATDTPTGALTPGTRNNLLKFKLTVSEGTAIINKVKIKQNPTSAQAENYRLTDVTTGIVLAENVNPANGYIEFTGFDNRNIGGVKTYLVSADIRGITDFIQLQLESINTMSTANISNLPLTGKTITISNNEDANNEDSTAEELTPILTVSLNSNSPSGTKTPKNNDILMKINLAVADNDLDLQSLTFKEVYDNDIINPFYIYNQGQSSVTNAITSANKQNSLITFNFSDLMISQGSNIVLEVGADTSDYQGDYQLRLVEVQSNAYVKGLIVNSNLLSYSQSTTTSSPPSEETTSPPTNVQPAQEQPISETEAKYRERIRQLQYQINDLEQQVINLEKQLAQTVDSNMVQRTKGKILLQVENNGEAWYVDPEVGKKYYLKDGESAYVALNAFGLGITNADLAKIPVGIEDRFQLQDSDGDGLADKLEESLGTNINLADSDGDGYSDGQEVKSNYDPTRGAGAKYSYDNNFANRLKGKILLQVQDKGQAWYINPADGKRYYLADGDLAYQIMRFLSLGITNDDLRKIPVGELF